jgi:hypothetical protein
MRHCAAALISPAGQPKPHFYRLRGTLGGSGAGVHPSGKKSGNFYLVETLSQHLFARLPPYNSGADASIDDNAGGRGRGVFGGITDEQLDLLTLEQVRTWARAKRQAAPAPAVEKSNHGIAGHMPETGCWGSESVGKQQAC